MCRCCCVRKVVSSNCVAAAETTATAAPLIYPTDPGKVVALRSWGSALGEKSGDFPGSGLEVGWETQGNHSKIKPSLCSLKSGLASRSGGCHSSHRRKTALAHQRASRCWGSSGNSRGKRGASWEYVSVSTATPQRWLPSVWRFTNQQPISVRATTAAGRHKKDLGKAGNPCWWAWYLWEWLRKTQGEKATIYTEGSRKIFTRKKVKQSKLSR